MIIRLSDIHKTGIDSDPIPFKDLEQNRLLTSGLIAAIKTINGCMFFSYQDIGINPIAVGERRYVGTGTILTLIQE